MSALPTSVNYTEPIPSLPDGTQTIGITARPTNGSSFTPSSVIQFDLVKRGFIIPDSVYIRYKAVVASATTASEMIGTPVYTPFIRLETFIGPQVVDSINQYNQVSNMLVNLTQDVASKYGLQYAYSYGTAGSTNTAVQDLDGKKIAAAGETYSVSAPLPCMLTACEKLIPAFAMPQIRLQFTMDTLNNMFAVIGGVTNLTISNFEVCYSVIDFGPEVENMVRNMGTFYLKSQSFFNTAYNIASGINGSITVPFNQSFQSIKSLYANFGGTGAASINKWGDSYDITQSNGDYSFSIAGVQYPQSTLSTVLNKAGVLQELRRAVGSIYGATNSLSINSIEFSRQGNDTTTSNECAKFWIGVCCEKLHSHALLTGVSSCGTAINLNVNLGTATAQGYNINLIINYDALIQIDTMNQQVNIVK